MSVVTQEQLAEATGFDVRQKGRIEKCLRDQGIAVFYGKNRIWTTTECIAEAANKNVISESSRLEID